MIWIFETPQSYFYVVRNVGLTETVQVGHGPSLGAAIGNFDDCITGTQGAAVQSLVRAAGVVAANDDLSNHSVGAICDWYTIGYDDAAEALIDALDPAEADRVFADVADAVESAYSGDGDVAVSISHDPNNGDPFVVVEAAYPKGDLADGDWEGFAEDDAWDAPDGWRVDDSGAGGDSLVDGFDGVVNTTWVRYVLDVG